MSLLVRRCLNRSHQLEEYIETWQIDHKEAMYADDLEELVRECQEVAPLLRRAWNYTVENLFDETARSDKVLSADEVIWGAIHRVGRVYRLVAKLIEGAERSGYPIYGAAGFRDQLRDVELLEREAERQRPPMDSQQMRESMEAYERGEFQTAEDALRELQGDSACAN